MAPEREGLRAAAQVGGLDRLQLEPRPPAQRMASPPDEDLPRRVTTYYPFFARNDQHAPEITVVVPVYNPPAVHLDECVRAVFRQTVRPREILIVDDGTTLVEARAYLHALRDRPGIRVVRNDRNIGLGSTMNRALRLCQTRFLLKIDADDVARPQLIAKSAAFIAEDSEIDVLGCQCQNFGQSSFVSKHPGRVTRDYVVNSNRYWFVNHTGVLLNRDSLLAVGGYRRVRGISEDYELWVRMMLHGFRRFYNLPDILVDYRDLPTGLHHNFRRIFNRAMLMFLKKLMLLCPRF